MVSRFLYLSPSPSCFSDPLLCFSSPFFSLPSLFVPCFLDLFSFHVFSIVRFSTGLTGSRPNGKVGQAVMGGWLAWSPVVGRCWALWFLPNGLGEHLRQSGCFDRLFCLSMGFGWWWLGGVWRWSYSIVGLLVDWLRWSAVADGKLGISQRSSLGFGFLGLGLAQETQNLGGLGFSLWAIFCLIWAF